MARQANIRLVGTSNNVIYYQRNGVGYMRSKPVKVRQTKPTQRAASLFGRAAMLGRSIREQLKPVLPNPADRKMQHGLRYALQQWLQAMHNGGAGNGENSQGPLTGLELNSKAGAGRWLKTAPTVERRDGDTLAVGMPAMNPVQQWKAPARTVHITCTCMAISCSTENPAATSSCLVVEQLPYTDAFLPARTLLLPMPAQPGHLLLLVTALVFKDALHEPSTKSLTWMPVVVVGAWKE